MSTPHNEILLYFCEITKPVSLQRAYISKWNLIREYHAHAERENFDKYI